MSDFIQNSPESTGAASAGYEGCGDLDTCFDDALLQPTGNFGTEPDILGQALGMLGNVKGAITQAEPSEAILQRLLDTEQTIAGLAPPEPEDGAEPEVGKIDRENPGGALNHARDAVISLLDQCTEQWGFANRPASLGADRLQHARDAALRHILSVLEYNFGLVYIDIAPGSSVDHHEMEVVAQVPTDNPAQDDGKVAGVIRVGFVHSDGKPFRTAHVHQSVSAQTHADQELARRLQNHAD